MAATDGTRSQDASTTAPTGGVTDEAIQEAIDGFDRAICRLPVGEVVWRARFTQARRIILEEARGRALEVVR